MKKLSTSEKILKIIYFRRRSDHSEDIFDKHKILTVYELHIYELLKFVLHSIHGRKFNITPIQIPNLTRKPMSTVMQSVKRKRTQLSPAMESEKTPDNPNLVNDIVKNIVPALVLALKKSLRKQLVIMLILI